MMPRIPLSARMNGITNLSTATSDRYQELVLDIDVLVPAHENFYTIEGIDELAENMLDVGHIEPIAIAKVDGKYKIVSGHRRYYAIKKNVDAGYDSFRKVRCTVREMSQPMYMLTLTSANAFTRKLDDATLVQQADVMEKALQELIDSGELKIKGKRRDYMASLLGVSSTKMAQVHKISTSLIDEGKEALASGKMNFSKAYETAKLEPKAQRLVIDDQELLSKDVKEFAKKMTFQVDAACDETSSETTEAEADEVIKTSIPKAEISDLKKPESVDDDAWKIYDFLENYKRWGLWFHEPHIDADFYRYEASGGTFYVAEYKKPDRLIGFGSDKPFVFGYFSAARDPFRGPGADLHGTFMCDMVRTHAPEVLKED